MGMVIFFIRICVFKKDPNMINFLINHGANLKKHLFFRKKENQLY